MEELKNLTNSSSITRISLCLHKIYKKIIENREKNIAEHNIKEIELLKNYCKTDNIQLCLMCCQTFVKLVENGALELNSVLNFFLTILPNSNFGQYTTITEGILSLLLLNLKRKTAQLKSNEKYECPYGLRNSQHPLITLIQNNTSSINDITNKITGICNHHDKGIRKHCIEFLRPVCLYIFCNPQTIPDSKAIWTNLLALSKTSSDANNLIWEILTWSKINSPSTCLFTSILLIETIEHYKNLNNVRQSSELLLYLSLIINHLIEYGIDPRPSLQCILRVLINNENINFNSNITTTKNNTLLNIKELKNFYNIILIILSKSLHYICPIYLSELFRIFEFIIIKKSYGNQYILNMILDGTIQWMARISFVPSECIKLANNIIKKIIQINDIKIINRINDNVPNKNDNDNDKNDIKIISSKTINDNEYKSNIRYYHPDIALAFDIVKLADSFDESDFKNVFTFIDSLNSKIQTNFCNHIQLFLRALFLSKDPSLDCWYKIYQIILSILKTSDLIAYDFLMTYIYRLANETHPEIQLELLRGLPNFAVSKDCIPMILNTLKSLSHGTLTTLCMDLYLRLWKLENRTYPYIREMLMQNIQSWEFNIAKAYTIREVCLTRPLQHYIELVPLISDIFNKCSKESDDLAISISLEAILILCENNVINIVSTWKGLSGKFRHEKRHKSLQSLYKFFGTVALLESPTKEYDQLFDESLEQLWLVVSTSNDSQLIRIALKSLANFKIEHKMTLKHIPDKFKYEQMQCDGNNTTIMQPIFRGGVAGCGSGINMDFSRMSLTEIQEQIPGYVWILLLRRIKLDCIENASDLISHYIEEEISSFRSGVYRLPEGKPEPRKLALFEKSPLKAITNFLIVQSRYCENFDQQQLIIIINALRTISKKFSKPIPPLDWSFLHSYFHINFLTRKYCILIAKNQLQSSGTAKRFIENILFTFEPNIFEEDLLLIFSILPDLVMYVSLNVLKTFIDKIATYCYRESQINGFQEGCLFEKFLDSMKDVSINKLNYPEVLNIFTAIAERYMDAMDLDTKVFQKYTEFVATLDTKSIDELTSPVIWLKKQNNDKIDLDKLKKSTLIRCYLVLYNSNLYNPLNWLDTIIDAFVQQTSEQIFFFRHLSVTLYAFNNDKLSCEWIIELITQIQSLLIDNSINKQQNQQQEEQQQQQQQEQKRDKLLFLLDIFVLSIVVLSSCAILLGNLNYIATSRKLRMEIFAESMQILCEHVFWKDNELRIYEFLYNLYRNPVLPDDYSDMFKNSIICSRHKQYFESKNIWTKYIGMRK